MSLGRPAVTLRSFGRYGYGMNRIACPHCSHSFAVDTTVRVVDAAPAPDLESYLPTTSTPRTPRQRALLLADLAVAQRFASSGVWSAPLLSADLFRVFESWNSTQAVPVQGMTARRLSAALIRLGSTWSKTAAGRVYWPPPSSALL